ncbi:MAG: hypothetical protein NUV97_03535 [archaeon]|nr:hypothetical protein [archaeon]MCR4323910.1 hypothetical protein [Nanoarchaeota archaeon]
MGSKNILLVMGVLLFGIILQNVSGAAFSGQTSPAFSGSTNNWQSYQPNFQTLYSGQMNNYWPILRDIQNDQCEANSDFVIGIPPGGCTPMVVRSDLLEEQNVPVFCQLYAIKVNPLIKVSSIKSIAFKGSYPEGVSGISFHPARAAIRSYTTLLGDPLINNIGYVVIILKQNKVESEMEDWIAGNLTATISYDADQAYGTGSSEYYSPVMNERNWSMNYEAYSFWNGKGYLRVTGIDRNSATIEILSDKDRVLKTFVLEEGKTSDLTYMPGYYCRAGLKVRLNGLDTPADMALINMDGSNIWVREGTKLLNGACSVRALKVGLVDTVGKTIVPNQSGTWPEELIVTSDGTNLTLGHNVKPIALAGHSLINFKTIKNQREVTVGGFKVTFDNPTNISEKITYYVETDSLSSPGPKTIWKESYIDRIKNASNKSVTSSTLPLKDFETGSISISCPGKTIDLKLGAADLAKDGSGSIGSLGTDKTNPNIDAVFEEGKNTVEELVSSYVSEMKDGEIGLYSEEALFEQIQLAGRASKFVTKAALIDLFLEKYPTSTSVNGLMEERQRLGYLDYSGAYGMIYANGGFHSVNLVKFENFEEGKKSIDLGISGKGIQRGLKELGRVELDVGEYIFIEKIYPNKVQMRYVNDDLNAAIKTRTETVYEDSKVSFGKWEVTVDGIDALEVAHISLIPEIKNTRTEANFTFRIGIEKRGIELSPNKTKEMLANINKSIKDFEEVNEKLGDVIKGWKGACLATSTVLMIKNALSGMDGRGLARQKVMAEYKMICDRDYKEMSKEQCYNLLEPQIEKDVKEMTTALNVVNSKMDNALKGNTIDGGLGEDSVRNETKYKEDLRKELGNWSKKIGNTEVNQNDLQTITQLQVALLDKALEGKGGALPNVSRSGVDSTLRNIALMKESKIATDAAAAEVQKLVGTGVPAIHLQSALGSGMEQRVWDGQFLKDYPDLKNGIRGNDSQRIQFFEYDNVVYLLLLDGSSQAQNLIASKAYRLDSLSSLVDSRIVAALQKFAFSTAGQKKGDCSNAWPQGKAMISYYESGSNKGLPAIVPFDLNAGWYAMVPNSGGTFLDNQPQGYTASADVSYFKICNIGANKFMENGLGDDFCQGFSMNSADSVDEFRYCPGELSSTDVKKLYNKAREAIRQASAQSGQKTVSIFDQMIGVGAPMSEIGGFECQDFMSNEDCKIMFNVCDPVICPSSRCDLGGKMPVADVIQTGIIGSIALCLPNAAEGIYVPICLSGIHAGIDSFVSILRSERECLQKSLDTGEHVGICDEVASIYKCEFFWKQASPLIEMVLPKLLSGFSEKNEKVRGGGEYLLVQSAFSNLEKSVDFFKNIYAPNAFRAFEMRSTAEAGGTFCKAFIGTSVPNSASLLDSLLEPESPHQFYAYFSEDTFSEATVPATSHYKVYYHIYAGKDKGVQYQVYLKNPPASSYYVSTPTVPVASGYIAKGDEADEAKDFTFPSGYKELCVVIDAHEECGFKQVTTSFALNYVQQKYTEEQATKTDITSEKECVSGSQSALSLASPNLQAGAEEAINPEIALRGIVRICATGNPNAAVGESARWKEVGYCGDSNLKCWLDLDSVEKDLRAIAAIDNKSISLLDEQKNLIDNTRKGYGDVAKELDRLNRAIKSLKPQVLKKYIYAGPSLSPSGEEVAMTIGEIIIGLNTIIDIRGGGSNKQKAEALALKAELFRLIVDEKLKAEVSGSTAVMPAARTAEIVEKNPLDDVIPDIYNFDEVNEWKDVRVGDVLYNLLSLEGERSPYSYFVVERITSIEESLGMFADIELSSLGNREITSPETVEDIEPLREKGYEYYGFLEGGSGGNPQKEELRQGVSENGGLEKSPVEVVVDEDEKEIIHYNGEETDFYLKNASEGKRVIMENNFFSVDTPIGRIESDGTIRISKEDAEIISGVLFTNIAKEYHYIEGKFIKKKEDSRLIPQVNSFKNPKVIYNLNKDVFIWGGRESVKVVRNLIPDKWGNDYYTIYFNISGEIKEYYLFFDGSDLSDGAEYVLDDEIVDIPTSVSPLPELETDEIIDDNIEHLISASSMRYPVIGMTYPQGRPDYFGFRWNSRLNKVQTIMRINEGTFVVSSSQTEKWYDDIETFEGFKGEGDEGGLYEDERALIREVVKSRSMEEVVQKIYSFYRDGPGRSARDFGSPGASPSSYTKTYLSIWVPQSSDLDVINVANHDNYIIKLTSIESIKKALGLT